MLYVVEQLAFVRPLSASAGRSKAAWTGEAIPFLFRNCSREANDTSLKMPVELKYWSGRNAVQRHSWSIPTEVKYHAVARAVRHSECAVQSVTPYASASCTSDIRLGPVMSTPSG